MADGTTVGGQTYTDPKVAEQAKLQEQGHTQQMELLALQQKTNQQNTLYTALSTLNKGNDDVLRAIANNLK